MADARNMKLLIVEARFYDHLADALLEGAKAALDAAGASYDVVTVPGALEVPAAISFALDAAEEGGTDYDGFVALGPVIRGETYHIEIVANENRLLRTSADLLQRVLIDAWMGLQPSQFARHYDRRKILTKTELLQSFANDSM